MKWSRKKIVISSLSATLAVLLLIGAAIGYTYYLAVTGQSKITIPEFTLKPNSKIKLGDEITVTTLVKCPWGHHPEKAVITLPDGVQIIQEPTISQVDTKWGKSVWEINAEIQPYRTGKMKKSECSVDIIAKKDGKTTSKTLKGEIPTFEVLAVDTGKNHQLDVASTVKETSLAENNPWILILIAFLALIGTAIFLVIWLNKRKEIMNSLVLPPWLMALSLLHKLREELKEHKIKGQVCITRLSDIVRNYLEQRFNINAPSQTTHEFLLDLDKGDSPLQLEHKQFLRDFLTAADMVKFAKLPANKALLDTALNKAEQLIKSTTPEENE